MKKTPQMEKLEELLRSGRLVVGGFMAHDDRSLTEVIEADLKVVEKNGKSCREIAERMRQITETAKDGLGQSIKISEKIRASVEHYRGRIICPWPHPGTFPKRITTVEKIETGEKIGWTDLNIHMIGEHSFFEGKGSMFRIEPDELIKLIF